MIGTEGKGLTLGLTALMTAMMPGGRRGNKESDGKVKLPFQIWDMAQRNGVEVVANTCMEKHPNVEINVQVASWSKYRTELDAATESNQLPDIFWIHTNRVLRYADYGMLADVTDLYNDVDKDYYTKHLSEISLGNAKDSDGRLYGVPEDKDFICLIHNREVFDAAGVMCPDRIWTQNDLTIASAKIHEGTGEYEFMAYAGEQPDYWNLVHRTGGYTLDEGKTRVRSMDERIGKGTEFYVNLQREPWYPGQNYFAETNPSTAFTSEQGAVYLGGNRNPMSMMGDSKDVVGRWDVAVLPKCPGLARRDRRASVSGGLCYAIDARGEKLEYAKGFLKSADSKEGQRIQGLSGAAISAYIGLEDTWVHAFDRFDYVLNVQRYVNTLGYGVQNVNSTSCPN